MKQYYPYDNMCLPEFLIKTFSTLQLQNLQIKSIAVDRKSFETLEMNLGSSAVRTKKGHIKIWVGHPYSYELTVKRAKK